LRTYFVAFPPVLPIYCYRGCISLGGFVFHTPPIS
jgi:hypothetical protein